MTIDYLEYLYLAVNTVLSLILLYYSIRLLDWIYNYVQKVWVLNKIPGLPMIPFFGNINKFIRPQSGIILSLSLP